MAKRSKAKNKPSIAPKEISPFRQKNNAKWLIRLGEVKIFALENKRWPSSVSENPIEKKLGKWWSRVKYYALKETATRRSLNISQEQAIKVRELVAQFPSLENKSKWYSNFRKVELQILAARSLWKKSTATADEIKLINWWNYQRYLVKKLRKGEQTSGMTEEKAQLMDELLKFKKIKKKKQSFNHYKFKSF